MCVCVAGGLFLEQFCPNSGVLAQCYLPVYDFHAFKAVVGYEQVAVEVGPVNERRDLCRGAYAARRFGHTAHHYFHTERTGYYGHFVSLVQAGAFHEFDVYAVVSLLQARYVANALEGFVGYDGQRAAVAQPCCFLEFFLGQGLLHEQASQSIIRRASSLSFHPWLASTQMGTSVMERIISTVSLSLSRPIFTFSIL